MLCVDNKLLRPPIHTGGINTRDYYEVFIRHLRKRFLFDRSFFIQSTVLTTLYKTLCIIYPNSFSDYSSALLEMIITRTGFIKLCTSILSLVGISNNDANSRKLALCDDDDNAAPDDNITFEKRYHNPPFQVNYANNPTAFGRILDGTLTSSTLSETDNLIVIQDRTPRADLHALVIPKQYIKTIYSLTSGSDLDLLYEMKEAALLTLQHRQPCAFKDNDYLLCFHIPPFISVEHLHLHVLAPASEMKAQYKWGKYLTGSFWCTSLDDVIDSLN